MKYALHFAVVALSAAFACATPTEYRDGPMVRPAPVRVVPGFTPPGTGLPEYMTQPEPPAYPRSPHKRPLPPSREPGIWAGDGPKAAAGPPKLEIAGVQLPVPEPERSVSALEGYAPHLCHGLITHNAFSPAYILSGDALTPEQKACLIATWYKHCLSWAAEAIVDRRSKGIATITSPFWKRYVDPASGFEKEKCTPEILNSKDRHGRDPLQRYGQLPAGYWDDVYRSYLRTNP